MSIWKQLYQAYENKDCNLFKKLWSNLSNEDKNSPYFSKYQSLFSKLCPTSNKKWKILIKWKTIKCPHCWANISKSSFNLESIKKLKQGQRNITFICNNCWTKFSWTKTPFKSIFSNYSIWQEIKIKWDTYKLAWAIKYIWKYNENWEWWGKLKYIEWLAYNKKWELFYISESRATDIEWIYEEIEISKKINFPFVIKNYDNYYITTDWWNYNIKEIDEVQVLEVFWEVNKSYKIWERIQIYNFQNYSLEIEATNNGIERNLYQKVNSYNNPLNFLSWIIPNQNTNQNKISIYISLFIIWFFIVFPFIKMFTFNILTWMEKPKKIEKRITIKQKNNIWTWNFEYKFFHPLTKINYIKSYDYGWKKYKKNKLEWFKFSIQNNKDKILFIKFLNNKNMINKIHKTSEVNNILINNKKIIISDNDLILKYK